MLPISDEQRRHGEISEVCFSEYEILSLLHREFNYVYLALDRASSVMNFYDGFVYRKRVPRMFYEEQPVLEPERVDFEIRAVENLIARYYQNASILVNSINNEFSDAILKSALNVREQMDIEEVFDNMARNRAKSAEVLEIKNSYIKIMRELNLANEDEMHEYAIFFEKYAKALDSKDSPAWEGDLRKKSIEKLVFKIKCT